jgi:hypothetical protein
MLSPASPFGREATKGLTRANVHRRSVPLTGELAQLVERVVRNDEVRGSTPLLSTPLCCRIGGVMHELAWRNAGNCPAPHNFREWKRRFADTLPNWRMKRSPSFHTLYLHSRPRIQPNEERRMEQWERFGVASLGSVLQHDCEFRSHFLERVCGWTGPGSATDFEVLLEVTNCGDLVLAAPTLGIVFVIECKIGAPLQPNQFPGTGIPERDVFFDSGYGAGIRKEFPLFKQRTYIVLHQSGHPIANPRPGELLCMARPWSALLGSLTASSLAKDLFDSLAQFGVRCFGHMTTQNMKLSDAALNACRINSLLKNAAEVAGWRDSSEEMELEGTDSGYIGRAISCKGAPQDWVDFIAPTDAQPKDHLTWFGYQDGSRSVGFYCSLRKIARVRTALEKYAGTLGKVNVDRDYVWIEADESQTLGDQEWFVEIYHRLRNAPELKSPR